VGDLIQARLPTEAGNKIIDDPDGIKRVEDYINKVKAEAEERARIQMYLPEFCTHLVHCASKDIKEIWKRYSGLEIV